MEDFDWANTNVNVRIIFINIRIILKYMKGIINKDKRSFNE